MSIDIIQEIEKSLESNTTEEVDKMLIEFQFYVESKNESCDKNFYDKYIREEIAYNRGIRPNGVNMIIYSCGSCKNVWKKYKNYV